MPLTEEPDLIQLLYLHSEAWFQAYHAPIVGRVTSYATSPARVDAQPIVLLRVEGQDVITAPVLRSVPVAFPGGTTTAYTYPLTPGADTVALVPQDADIGAYVASGSVNQLPQSTRRFSLSDCIAIPNNLRPGGSPLPATAFAADGAVLYGLHYAGGGDATDFAAMAAKVLSELSAIVGTYNGHTHGGAVPIPVAQMAAPASVASTFLKVK